MNNSLVSIIMPAYNAEKFIDESIKSVINQSYKNWELIIVNDCSEDSTQKIVESYCLKDKRIKLFVQDKNKGVVEARNRALKESKGRYIAFLDSDDLWEVEKLEIQIKYMIKNDICMSYTSYSYISENGKILKEIEIPKSLTYKQALKGNKIGCLTVVIDRIQVGDFQMPNIRHEDYATWLNILKKNITAYGIEQNLAKYRKVENSLSSNKFRTIKWTWNIFVHNQKISKLKSIYYLSIHLYTGILKHFIVGKIDENKN